MSSNGTVKDNPYLAHLPPTQRGVTPKAAVREPLYGWVPRMVKGENVRTAMVCP